MPAEARYDLFISYAFTDRPWVEGYLRDALDRAGVRYLHEAAFDLGAPRLTEFERAVRESGRTLLVLSPAYLADGFGAFLDVLAQSLGAESGTWPVIPLVLQPCDLPPRLRILTALDATDPARWEVVVGRLCEELNKPSPGPAAIPECPYPGMRPYEPAEADRFFGRDNEIAILADKVGALRRIFVLGASGSGKSSLVKAGLLPRLDHDEPGRWHSAYMRPSAEPLARLAEALGVGRDLTMPNVPGPDGQGPEESAPDGYAADLPSFAVPAPDWADAAARSLARAAPAERLLLIVDQAEELFTLGASREAQAAFAAALAAIRANPACRLVLTLRSDFLGDLQNSDFWPVDPSEQVQIGPLRGEGLKDAIRKPAEAQGVAVDPALVERLAADATGAPGVLPMLQEAMRRLWRALQRRYLPLAAYEQLGRDGQNGLVTAIAAHADGLLQDEISTDAARGIARRIFLRLIQFGEGRADTRRQQPKHALRSAGEDAVLFEATLKTLVDHRLLTSSSVAGEARMDIAHEALIAGWPALRQWIDGRRQAELLRRRLEDAAARWVEFGRGEGGLLDEVELREAERWLAGAHSAELGYSEVVVSLVWASRGAIAREAEARARFERTRRGRLLASLFAGLATLALIVAVVALYSNYRLVKLLRANEMASTAQVLVSSRPQRALLLAAQAMRVAEQAGSPRSGPVETALREVRRHVQGRPLIGHAASVENLAFSPDGAWLATGSDDTTTRLWRVDDPGAAPIVLAGHADQVVAVAFDPRGTWLATGSEDATVRLWRLGDPGAEPTVLRGAEGPIAVMAFSPDGAWLATGGDDATARLWRVGDLDAEPIILRGHEDKIEALAFSPDGAWLATAGDDTTARLWRVGDRDAEPIVLRGHADQIEAMAFSPDGAWLATGSKDSTVRLWPVGEKDAQPIVLRGYAGTVAAVAFSPDGAWLAAASHDATVRLWSVEERDARPIILREHEGPIVAVVFSPDGKWLATASDDATVRLWSIEETVGEAGAEPIVLRGHDDQAEAVAFSPNGKWLATGSQDATARLWPVGAISAEPIVLSGYADQVEAVAFSPNREWLLTGNQDTTARLWRVEDSNAGPVVLRGHADPIVAVAFSPSGEWLATGSQDSTARLWRVGDLPAEPVVLSGHENSVESVAFSPDETWLATGSDDMTARLWRVDDPEAEPIVLSGHEDEVESVAFSPDGVWLATGSDDTTVRLWRVDDPIAEPIVLRGPEKLVLREPRSTVESVAFSPDGVWLATGSDDTMVRLWRVDDPSVKPIVLRGHDDQVQTVAFSPDGAWLASAGTDTTVRLWRVANPVAAPIVLRGHERSVASMAFSPDGAWLATASWDTTARLWRVDPARVSDSACAAAGRNLTQIEWSQYIGDFPYECTCSDLPAGEGAPPDAPGCRGAPTMLAR